MQIIFKYVLKNILEKKLRTLLIVLSIAVSAALFFASNSVKESFMQMVAEREQQYFGTSDFMIHAGSSSTSRNFNTLTAEPYKDKLEYIIGGFDGSAVFTDAADISHDIGLKSVSYEDLSRISPLKIIEASGLLPFEGKKLIISRASAQRLGLSLGDSIDLKVRGSRQKFMICAVAAPEGFLFDDGESNNMFVPMDSLSSLYNARGKVNMLYIKLKNPEEKAAVIEQFRKLYKYAGFSYYLYGGDMAMPFKMMTYIVCFMSVFIIYSTFKVIMLERLPVIGIFRSIGATKNATGFVLLLESAFYGILGGGLGCLMGIGVLYAMSDMMKEEWMKEIPTAIRFSPVQMLISFVIAVLLCLVSSLIPIIRTSKIPLKELVLNVIEKDSRQKTWKPFLGLLFLIASLSAPYYVPRKFAMPVDMVCIILLSVSAVLLLPRINSLFAKVLEKVYAFVFGNEGVIAAKNVKDNKSHLTSMSLLSLAISTLLMITMVSDSFSTNTLSMYSTVFRFDINMRGNGLNKSSEQLLKKMEGVSDTYGSYIARWVRIDGFDENIRQIDGISSPRYFEFCNIDSGMDHESLFKQLDSGRNILLSSSMNYYMGLKTGDTITLKMPKGDRVYTVAGFFDTGMYNGKFALASEKYIKLDTGNRNYSNIYIKASTDQKALAEEIQETFKRQNPWIETIEEAKNREIEGTKQISDILLGFSILSLAIGIIGIFNSFLINFIERKHSLAVLKSIGMSRKQVLKMLFVEALTAGLIGGSLGITVGTLQLIIVPILMRAIGQFLAITYSIETAYFYLAAGVLITLAVSVIPAMKSSKLDIISTIKFE